MVLPPPLHVVIVGGGFGGLYAAPTLANQPVRVTLLDRHNHHLFQPLIYQVATAVLHLSDIATPLRSILRRAANVTVFLAEVEAVDLAGHRVVLDEEEVADGALVLAPGAGRSYFGHDDWEPLAPSLAATGGALARPAAGDPRIVVAQAGGPASVGFNPTDPALKFALAGERR